MSSLPTEILIQIFILFASKDHLAPVKLSMVCSRWRTIAHGLPKIWTRLICRPSLSPLQWSKQIAAYFTQSYPLTVTVDIKLLDGGDDNVLLFVALLLPYHTRWTSTRLSINGRLVPINTGNNTKCSLVLSTSTRRYHGLSVNLSESVNVMPSLSVNTNGLPPCQMDLPFENVTVIDGLHSQYTDAAFVTERVLSYLIHCPRLSTFTLRSSSSARRHFFLLPTSSPVSHPGVTSIFLHDTRLAPFILSSLCTPRLTELGLLHLTEFDTFPSSSIDRTGDSDEEVDYIRAPVSVRLIGRSLKRLINQSPGIRLCKLTLHASAVRGSDFDFLFDRLSHLEELYLAYVDISNRVLGLLEHEGRLPILHTLELESCFCLTGEVVVRVLAEREKGLKRVVVVGISGYAEKHKRQLREIFGGRIRTR